ncbi:LPXTG cell wall anchor domain-containing protein [Cytobacillus firmus]|uniref:LPXTG cell wall anchor domain-containing protein n=1 Tax=Cytobacillus firmus TaxID=1399 RepID=UPI001C95C333|nr:LPXTG cell wall anchor domain-containing protein [Cytobacillus firmus]MBY6051979.1 LPXTG cell wall anchor domain-containing protein [Cytobacillus firmus]
MRGFIKVSTFIFWLIFILVFQSSMIFASAAENEVDIETIPDRYAFNISKMIPGDWVSRTLTIQNRGKKDFNYYTEAKFLDGSTKLYNAFSLKVWDSQDILFDGKLNEFEGLNTRFLKSRSQEDLKFEVKFPYELGNEFQGLSFKFEIRFIVKGSNTNPDPDNPTNPSDPITDPEGPTNPGNPDSSDPADEGGYPIQPQRPIPADELANPPVDGQILPSTATSTYNNLLLGILLVISGGGLFILQKRKKNLKHDHSRP